MTQREVQGISSGNSAEKAGRREAEATELRGTETEDLLEILHRVEGRAAERIVPVKGRRAAVLIPLLQNTEGELSILFEVRGADVGQPGEVCFPGGRVEPGEEPGETVLRETCEELLLDPSQVQIAAPMHVMSAHGGTEVYSYLGVLHGYPGTYSEEEVDHVFTVPLRWFRTHPPRIHDGFMMVDPGEGFPYELIPHGRNYPWHKVPRCFYFYETKEAVIWGMTADLLYYGLDVILPE